MDKLNTLDKRNHKRYNSWKNLWYALILAGLLDMNTPSYAQMNTPIKDATEQVQPQIDKALIQIPSIYQGKIDELLKNNNVMKDNDAKNFTEDFISKEMEADWKISKENQLLFIRHSIYKQVTDQDLYDGKDGNQQIAEDFNNKGVNIRIKVCWQRYKDWIIAYMSELSAEAEKRSAEAEKRSAEAEKRSAEAEKRSAEAEKRSAEAEKRSAEAEKRSAEADSLSAQYRQQSINAINNTFGAVIDFYNSYQASPDPKRLESFKPKVERLISRCKELDINYKEKLPKEVREFFNIE